MACNPSTDIENTAYRGRWLRRAKGGRRGRESGAWNYRGRGKKAAAAAVARWRQVAALTVLAVIAFPLAFALPGSPARAAASARASLPKPTIVLVHGAWADSSSWGKVIPRLESAGYTVLADPNPLRGLASDAAYLTAFVDARTTGPVVLVGHSYGGAVITDSALHIPRVKALVYVDAFAPAKGQTCLGLIASVPGAASPSTLFDTVKIPGAPAGDDDLYFKTQPFMTAFANGVPAATAKLLDTEQRPPTVLALTQPGSAPAFDKLPSWYVLGTEDRIIPPSLELQMALRAHSRITRVASGHLSLVTHPGVVTGVIEKAATWVSSH